MKKKEFKPEYTRKEMTSYGELAITHVGDKVTKMTINGIELISKQKLLNRGWDDAGCSLLEVMYTYPCSYKKQSIYYSKKEAMDLEEKLNKAYLILQKGLDNGEKVC